MTPTQDIHLDLEAVKLTSEYTEAVMFRDLKQIPEFARLVKAFAFECDDENSQVRFSIS